MWHRPRLLIALADLVFLMIGFGLIFLVVALMTRVSTFQLREVAFKKPLVHVKIDDVSRIIAGAMSANFFNLHVDEVQQELERIPWVRRAEVRRYGPYQLQIVLEEHQPVARWGKDNSRWVNTYGEVFSATFQNETLPHFNGPEGSAVEVLSNYNEFSSIMKQIGMKLVQLSVSPRQAWLLRTHNGNVFKLGREQRQSEVKERLLRFVMTYPALVEMIKEKNVTAIKEVDLSYPNGFAIQLTDGQIMHKEGT